MLRQPRRRGDESDNDHHHNRRKMLPREFHCANLSSLGVNLLRVTSGNGDLSVQVSAPTLNLKPDARNLLLPSTLVPRHFSLGHFHPTDTIFRLRNAICVASGNSFGQTSWQAISDIQPKTPSSSPINS